MEKKDEREKQDDEEKPAAGLSMEVTPVSRCSSFQVGSGAETSDGEQFKGALRELKELRCQLHQAADYCEDAFLKAEKKKIILESTKKYICDSVVAVIDHLGTVSSKLEHQLCNTAEITQTEQKIDFLKNRLMTCQQFAVSIELSEIRYNDILTRTNPHYILQGERMVKCDYQSREEHKGLKNIKESNRGDQLGLSGRFRLAPNFAGISTLKLFSRQEHGMSSPRGSSPSAVIKSPLIFKDAHIFERENIKVVHQRNNFWSLTRKNKKNSKILSSRAG
ncbi:hypothetical protein LUZ60_001086 [Juncus effusus]|nr:hypothetical protein LUZ60_001086 [Juncus effusus]